MQINFHLYTASIHTWQEERDMLAHLATCELGQVILGQTAEQKLEFYTCTFAEFRPKRRFGVGICSEGHGLKPGLFPHPERERCYFGFNSQIIAVDIQERRVVWGRNLDSLFYTFLYVASERIVLGLHEIGVVALSLDGEMLWSYSRDVVTDVQISAERVRLEFMDAAPTSLELLRGEVIQQNDATNR